MIKGGIAFSLSQASSSPQSIASQACQKLHLNASDMKPNLDKASLSTARVDTSNSATFDGSSSAKC